MKKKFILISLLFLMNILLFAGIFQAIIPTGGGGGTISFNDFFDEDSSKGIETDTDKWTLTFTETDSVATTKTNGEIQKWEKIKPANENTNAFIEISKFGDIKELDLTASEDTEIEINGVKIPLQKNFRVVFKGEKLQIIAPSGSPSIENLPEIPETFFENTPKEIIYKVEGGEKLKWRNYLLEKGELKYSLENQKFYVPKGSEVVLNNFYIDAHDSNVILNENIYFDLQDKGIKAKGSGFDISFNSDTSTFKSGSTPVSLSKSKNGKYFQIGDSGSDVKEIQKIVGLSPTGNYDKVTFEAVKKWQKDSGLVSDGKFGKNSLKKVHNKYSFDLSQSNNEKYFRVGDSGESVKEIQRFLMSKKYLSKTYVNKQGEIIKSDDGQFGSRTKTALENWQKDSGLVSDGKFGKDSLAKVEKADNNVIVFMRGGNSEIKNTQEGLNIVLEGKTGLTIGDKSYLFDGKRVDKKLFPLLESQNIEIPTKITFLRENGNVELNLEPNKEIINEDTLEQVAADILIDPSSASCAGLVTATCPLLIEGKGETIGEIARDQGIYGSAWEMQKNMINKGGKKIYTKEDFLTTKQKEEIKNLKQQISGEYNQYKKQGLSEKEINRRLSDKIRNELGNILNNNEEFFSQTIPLKGDVISFYYRDSGYLSEALLNGKNNQKNTHVGQITGYKSEIMTISGGKKISEQIIGNLGIDEKNIYVNDYQYETKQGDLQSLTLKDGEFYKKDGTLLSTTDTNEIIINRPQVAHMIHYRKGEDPYHIESLDEVISRNDLSLYGITRPKSSKYMDDIFSYPDVSFNKVRNLNCNSVNCDDFNFEEILRINQIEEAEDFSKAIIDSTKKVQTETGIPEEQIGSFVAVTSAIIKRESNFGDSTWYSIEEILGDKFGNTYTKGHMQINEDYIEKSSKKFNEKTPSTSEVYDNKEIGIKYGQRYLAEIFKIYAPEGKPVTAEQVGLIASAYNSGYYAPRNAAIQKQLQELGYYSKDKKADGLWGPETKKAFNQFAKDNEISLEGLTNRNVASKVFEETELYKKIKEEYREKTNQEPKYGIIPDISTSDIRGTRTVKRYANFVSKNYKNFCPTIEC